MRALVNLGWLTLVVVITFCCPSRSLAKVFERCELARELLGQHKLPMHQISDWICLVKWESDFNTSAVGRPNTDGSHDHGLFQFNDNFWCSQPNASDKACGLTCDQLKDDDIKNDVICAKRVFREFQRKTGNGFNAWVAWTSRCQGDTSEYIQDCFDTEGASKGTANPQEGIEKYFVEATDAEDSETDPGAGEANPPAHAGSRRFPFLQRRQSQAGQATIQTAQQAATVNGPTRMSQLKSSLLSYFGNLRLTAPG